MSQPRGIRNNNPGNIINNGIEWKGLKPIQKDGVYYEFIEAKWGIRAMVVILRNYDTLHGLNTIAEIIGRWAPPIENDTLAYIDSVAIKMGLDPHDFIYVFNNKVMLELLKAIIFHENGINPYSDQYIKNSIELANDKYSEVEDVEVLGEIDVDVTAEKESSLVYVLIAAIIGALGFIAVR